jgi:hypothetical protein
MRNEEVVEDFLNGISSKTRNVKTNGNMLYSYDTAIATHFPIGVIVNKTKYSQTTSRIQNKLISESKKRGLKVFEVDNLGYNLTRNDLLEAANALIEKSNEKLSQI